MDYTELLVAGGLGTLATSAIVTACRKAGLRSKYAPLFTLVVGMALSVVWGVVTDMDWQLIIIFGFGFAGVAAHGYDTVKQANKPY